MGEFFDKAAERNPDKKTIVIKRTNGEVHTAHLKTDERGRAFATWSGIDPETGEMEDYEKGLTDEQLADEYQDILREEYEANMARELGLSAVKVSVDMAQLNTEHQITNDQSENVREAALSAIPALREFLPELEKIKQLRDRESTPSERRYGMNPHDASDTLIKKLSEDVKLIYKPKLGEDIVGIIYKYVSN